MTQTLFTWQTLFFWEKQTKMYLLGWKGPTDSMADNAVSNKYARTFKYVGRPGRSPCSGVGPHTLQSMVAVGPGPPGCTVGGGGLAASPRLESLRERPRSPAEAPPGEKVAPTP